MTSIIGPSLRAKQISQATQAIARAAGLMKASEDEARAVLTNNTGSVPSLPAVIHDANVLADQAFEASIEAVADLSKAFTPYQFSIQYGSPWNCRGIKSRFEYTTHTNWFLWFYASDEQDSHIPMTGVLNVGDTVLVNHLQDNVSGTPTSGADQDGTSALYTVVAVDDTDTVLGTATKLQGNWYSNVAQNQTTPSDIDTSCVITKVSDTGRRPLLFVADGISAVVQNDGTGVNVFSKPMSGTVFGLFYMAGSVTYSQTFTVNASPLNSFDSTQLSMTMDSLPSGTPSALAFPASAWVLQNDRIWISVSYDNSQQAAADEDGQFILLVAP